MLCPKRFISSATQIPINPAQHGIKMKMFAWVTFGVEHEFGEIYNPEASFEDREEQ